MINTTVPYAVQRLPPPALILSNYVKYDHVTVEVRTDNQDVLATVMEARVAPANEAGLKSTSVTIPEQI